MGRTSRGVATGEGKVFVGLTDGGVNTTVTTFEHKGRQMVEVHAGGGAFAGLRDVSEYIIQGLGRQDN